MIMAYFTLNQPFILFIHHICGEIVPRGAVFIIQTYSGRSKHALAKPLKKFPKSPIRRKERKKEKFRTFVRKKMK